jgi:hypothetical protein
VLALGAATCWRGKNKMFDNLIFFGTNLDLKAVLNVYLCSPSTPEPMYIHF